MAAAPVKCVEGHSAMIHDRGGKKRLWALKNLSEVTWERVLSGTAEASITVTGKYCQEQVSVLSQIEAKRHELVIFRDGKREYEGPILDIGWFSDHVTIIAHDVSEYLAGTPLSKPWPILTRKNWLDNGAGTSVDGVIQLGTGTGPGVDAGGVFVTASASNAAETFGLRIQTLPADGPVLVPHTTYTFSAEIFGSTTPAELIVTGAGKVADLRVAIQPTLGQYLPVSVTFTTGASGSVQFDVVNSAIIASGGIVGFRKAQVELGLQASPYAGPAGTNLMTDRIQQLVNHELAVPYTMQTNGGPVVVPRWETIDPPINVLPFFEVQPGTVQTRSDTLAFQMNLGEHLYNLAESGVDFTCIGRKLLVWDSANPIGKTRTLTEADFYGSPEVHESGTDLAVIAHLSGQRPDPSSDPAPGPNDGVGNAGGADSYYGVWTKITSQSDEETTDTPTQPELNSQAQRTLLGRNPVPLEIVMPNNVGIKLSHDLTLANLVPGTLVPVLAKMNLRPISQMEKIKSVKVKETAKGETISLSLISAES